MHNGLKLFPLLAAAALAFAACSDPESGKTNNSGNAQSQDGAASGTFDLSELSEVPDIAAMVPEELRTSGVLRNGASTDYAPAEFRSTDGQTPVGYDIELVKALAIVMGLEEGQTTHAEFPTIIPALGTKYDIGASSFTITSDRLEQVNMVSYVEVGSAYAVATGNPSGFDPENPCGATIGVQNGTFQFDYAQELSDHCVADGQDPISIMPHDLQTDVTTKVIGNIYDATFADSTVVGYAIHNSNGQLEQVGDIIESAPQGIAVQKEDEQLAAAIQAALQYLMDEGYLKQILAGYGAEDAALTQAQINPTVD